MSLPNAVTEAALAEGVAALNELALNLHWSWNHAADALWIALDQNLWESTQNPWVILQTVSKDQISALLANPVLRKSLKDLVQRNRDAYSRKAWFQQNHESSSLSCVAYFSMEFMLSEALPIYSGGLGNVAGDQMKAASGLGVPVVGIGLLYGQGYFRQDFDQEGRQRALYPVNDPGQLPIRPLRRPDGQWLRIAIQLPEGKIWLRCWEVCVGRTKLYLLDANDFANTAAHRGITSELYGGDQEMRLKQEIVLGIGGWRLLRAIGLDPEVCHLNEGHAALAVLERARWYMEDHAKAFDVARVVTRAGNVFTTHTAVAAGFDRFDPELVRKYLTHYAEDELRISIESFLALGREDEGDASEPFNMAYLAVRGSGQVNGVSKLHGQVSRQIFQPLFPRWPQAEVPIGCVTNGIHVPTWDSAGADALWTKACGADRWRGAGPVGDAIRRVSDCELWQMRMAGRTAMISFVRKRFARQLASEGRSPLGRSGLFEENVLTVGFARRFATYKRPNLLLHDPERLLRLLLNPQRPMQMVIAGKAHPEDLPGQALVKEWNDFIQRPEVCSRVVFLSDYDMLLAQELVHGMDLWINTPRRPWEACGTSGMKVLVNGGLNLSELDGWWVEAYSPGVGWAIGDGREHGEDPAWDAAEAEAMYTLLENEVVPDFYERGPGDIPVKWLERVRESMARLTPEFSAGRAIRDYTEDHYLSAATAYLRRAKDNGLLGQELLQWEQSIAQHWDSVRFGSLKAETTNDHHLFRVEVFSAEIHPENLIVELYAEANSSIASSLFVMAACKDCSAPGMLLYSAKVPLGRPSSDYTPRVTPSHSAAFLPIESAKILWRH